eukprot:2835273-Amphidinium_carterae.1
MHPVRGFVFKLWLDNLARVCSSFQSYCMVVEICLTYAVWTPLVLLVNNAYKLESEIMLRASSHDDVHYGEAQHARAECLWMVKYVLVEDVAC